MEYASKHPGAKILHRAHELSPAPTRRNFSRYEKKPRPVRKERTGNIHLRLDAIVVAVVVWHVNAIAVLPAADESDGPVLAGSIVSAIVIAKALSRRLLLKDQDTCPEAGG